MKFSSVFIGLTTKDKQKSYGKKGLIIIAIIIAVGRGKKEGMTA